VLITVDPDGEVPIYQQLRDRIVEAIASGALVEGSSLPSTRQLAVDLGVNFHTVNKSYEQLKREGLVQLNRRSGAVVRRDPRSGPADPAVLAGWRERARTLLAEAMAQGVDPQSLVAECQALIDGLAGPDPSAEPRRPR